jgi:hypothetical protein
MDLLRLPPIVEPGAPLDRLETVAAVGFGGRVAVLPA